jgi:hypothetical protein
LSDRECLLVIYGALKAMKAEPELISLVKAHLFADKPDGAMIGNTVYISPRPGIFQDPKAKEELSAVEWPLKSPDFIQFAPKEEEKPATPGDYKLKRTGLGPAGYALKDCVPKMVARELAKYEALLAKDPRIHPHLLEDIEAARIYLGKNTP